MMNLENLTAAEAEALVYAEGYPATARLFARIDDLHRALGQAVAALEAVAVDLGTIKHARGAAREALDQVNRVAVNEGVIN